MKADSRDFAVDAGEEIRDTRIAWASGIVGGGVRLAKTLGGWDKLA